MEKKKKFLFSFLIIGILFLVNIVHAQEEAVQTQPGRYYQSVSFSELIANPSSWNEKYISIFGWYDKPSNTLKETDEAVTGLITILFEECYDYSLHQYCKLENSGWIKVNGLFTYDGDYKLKIDSIFTGKDVGYKCTSDNECNSNLCLFCPDMKMILAGFITYEDLPENAVKIDFSVTESGIVPETHKGSITLINPAPDYGYCAGGVLPTSGPDTQEYIDKVHQAYIDNNILESDEPFVWGPKTFADNGGSGYCIGMWNNNKYKWVLVKPGDEKYLNWIKDAFIQDVSDQYFNDYLELASLNRPKKGSIIYHEDRKDIMAGFKYSIGEYSFEVNYNVITHNLINDKWVETDESPFKSQVLSQQKIQEIENLLSKEDAFNKLKTECLLGLQETRINLLRDGTIVMDGQQTISMEENKCKYGRLDLQTGEILECRQSACYITTPGEVTYKPPIAQSTNIWIYVLVGLSILVIIFLIIHFLK